MKQFQINKGVGRTVEFKGLKAQYLFIFAGGLLAVLILVMILYMAGVNSYVCLFIAASASSAVVWLSFSLNKKFGEHGLMKRAARKKHPRYIVCRKSIRRCIRITSKPVQP